MHFKHDFIPRTPHSMTTNTEFVVHQCSLEEVSVDEASAAPRDTLCMRLKLGSLRPRRINKKPKPKTQPCKSRRRLENVAAQTSINCHPEPTPEETYDLNLMRFLARTYSLVEDVDCCSLHAAVKILRLSADRLQTRQCDQIYEKVTGQCKNCGFMCNAEDDMSAGCYECDWCGNDVFQFPQVIKL
eukprot:TRINITY_DN9746_c0_g1_i3.p1 TRINITY_DN9746_c0_g1~~TRINITY_DN9746_c0_g1_i3.p1  ORF type:complete len:186 (+),score=29.26 TRINITY_DN9746_c0_g1_i3:222-779(+)